jgi:hypothetical protein
VLIAISKSLYEVKQRCVSEMTKECVWVEIPVRNNYRLLIGNHYFASDCDINITENYLYFSEVNFSSHLNQVCMLDGFNVPNYHLYNNNPFPKFYYYNKVKGNFVYATSFFFGLNQHSCVLDSAIVQSCFYKHQQLKCFYI